MTSFAGLDPKYVKSSTYQARWDPDIFDIAIDYMRCHKFEWCYLEDVFSIDCWLAREIIQAARHVGDEIATKGQGKPGCMYVGVRRRHWVRSAILRAPWEPARDEEPADLLAGQMSLSLAAETA